MVLVQGLAKSLYNHPEWQRGREETVTNDAVVEVVRQHPLTHSHQQPEGFLLLSVQQQNGGQDVHGLLRGFTGSGQLLTRSHVPQRHSTTHKPKWSTEVQTTQTRDAVYPANQDWAGVTTVNVGLTRPTGLNHQPLLGPWPQEVMLGWAVEHALGSEPTPTNLCVYVQI